MLLKSIMMKNFIQKYIKFLGMFLNNKYFLSMKKLKKLSIIKNFLIKLIKENMSIILQCLMHP